MAATFAFNFNTLQLQLQPQQPQPHLLSFSLSLTPFTLKPTTSQPLPNLSHHHALAVLPNSNSSTSQSDRQTSPSTDTINFKQRKKTATGYSSINSVVETLTKNEPQRKFSRNTNKTTGYRDRSSYTPKKNKDNENLAERKRSSSNKKKDQDFPEVKLRVSLDMCSKRGDVMRALSLYDSAKAEGVKLGQHHYTVLLYLCSSAAVGVVRPAKSGSGARTLSASLVSSSNEVVDNNEEFYGSTDRNKRYELNSALNSTEKPEKKEDHGILVSEDVKKYAMQRGFEIYESMCLDKVPMNEAALTSVARMAMSIGDGDKAFEMVKQMKALGINPRLRSYGPALSTFCNNGEIDKAFEVEKHMLEHGVYPEEPELEALLRVSIGVGKADKVYYVLQKLRSNVRKVSPPTASLIIDWFKSTQASRVGKRKWDKRLIKDAMVNNGGGWHGQGWLGKGKWLVSDTTIGNDGICKCCGVQLATIDLDPIETENFAKSVASIAMMREKKSNFEKFQKWLDYYGPFEAVVDAANVGLFSQRRFMPSKINAVVNGIRQKLPSKRFPLIILHNRRIKGDKINEPINRALVDRWNNADALYATPTGSNDDWYWLYAAIKFKCLLVTNDEMRDHLFQLLGNDFFPKWKERHQVHFSFSDTGPEFHMPPPCSVVIQESEEGHWHIPIEVEVNHESERRWLCITRAKLDMVCRDSSTTSEDSNPLQASTEELQHQKFGNHEEIKETPQEMYKNLRDIFSASVPSDNNSILSEIVAAELIGGCTIDFQI